MATKKLNASTVITKAQEELGYLEKKSNSQLDDKTANAGSGNYTKYWRDTYPSLQGQAWCLCFCINRFEAAYGKDEAKKMLCMEDGLTFYTPTAAQNFKDAKRWYTKPEVGDLIFFKNSKRIHHVGLVYKVTSSTVSTIEGNTNSGTAVIPNGGSVCAKEYELTNSSIAGYGRPKYTSTTSIKTSLVEVKVVSDRQGLKIVGTSLLNVRKSPVNGAIVKTYSANTYHVVTAKVKASDGNWWFKTADGYISGKYVQGWLKENNNRWWYVKKGYTYDTLKICLIDGDYYGFDKEGYLITSDRINSQGQII